MVGLSSLFKLGEDEHLPGELADLLLLHAPRPLDGHGGAVGEDALVDNALASAAEDPCLGEPVGGLAHLLLGEDLERDAAGVGAQLLLQDEAAVLLEEAPLCSKQPLLLEPHVCGEAGNQQQEHADAHT